MKITLGIESSCDETAVALIEQGKNVLSSQIASQITTHKLFGGVVPEVAAREHLQNIIQCYDQCLKEAKILPKQIDGIAVTQGPGLIGPLLVGISFAKGLALQLQKPLIPVDHVHAHIHGALLSIKKPLNEVLPAISLVISGGHTNLYKVDSPTHFQLIASSVDDACGECFDKVGKLLKLPYPGGPEIEKLAASGNPDAFPMPRVMADSLNFSYSGLKTHMAQLVRKIGEAPSKQELSDLCASFQKEAFGQIIRKLQLASQKFPEAMKSVIIAGGVAQNKELQALLSSAFKQQDVYFPKAEYCSDNAAMIAAYGWHQHSSPESKMNYLHHNWDAYSRYQYETYKEASV